ncbi:MAG TPA: phosphoenolpyruvate synthase, partial [Bacteroidales bacterium]|nr:phosphoenolpyruvate synthase [Bacteroidales bacterium]
LYSPSALGNGIINSVFDIVYVKSDRFSPSKTHQIASELEQLNQTLANNDRNYILIGPGRWGSSDSWLGVPVKWPQISSAKIIVEAGQDNYKIDPSQGTHFFQNLTSFRVGYMTVNEYMDEGFIDYEYLSKLEACYETEMLRHVCLKNSLQIIIDGQKRIGVILKEGLKLA